jgi:NOL1/NOP2/fmu family ribosome biogenesis protein
MLSVKLVQRTLQNNVYARNNCKGKEEINRRGIILAETCGILAH